MTNSAVDGPVEASPPQAESPPSRPGADAASREWLENRAPHRWLPSLDVRELWRYRELALVLALRDLKVRYKQTSSGSPGWCCSRSRRRSSSRSCSGGWPGSRATAFPTRVFVVLGLGALDVLLGDARRGRPEPRRRIATSSRRRTSRAPRSRRTRSCPGSSTSRSRSSWSAIFMAAYGVAPGIAVVLLPAWIAACAARRLRVRVSGSPPSTCATATCVTR